MHYKVENYVDDEGQVITAKIPQVESQDLLLSNPTVYVGTVPLTVRTPQGVGQMPFEFEFPTGMSLADCFAKFEEVAKQKIDEFKQEQQDKNRIVPAKSMPPDLRIIK